LILRSFRTAELRLYKPTRMTDKMDDARINIFLGDEPCTPVNIFRCVNQNQFLAFREGKVVSVLLGYIAEIGVDGTVWQPIRSTTRASDHAVRIVWNRKEWSIIFS
jgi:hypothetical protein